MHGIDLGPWARVTGSWIVQEKFDGWRAFWDGEKLVSRQGVPFDAPAWFLAGLPSGLPLDCELFLGYGRRDKLNGCAFNAESPIWNSIRQLVFDSPTTPGGYASRHAAAASAIVGTHAEMISFSTLAENPPDLASLKAEGGEGYMLRYPHAPYRAGRSQHLLKLK